MLPLSVLGPLQAFISLALLLISHAQPADAQQYAGANYTNSMPGVPGAEITFWNIVDSKNRPTSLLNYHILNNNKRQDPSKVKRAIIVVHGLNQDPGTYMANMLSALNSANKGNSAINSESVAIVAPLFANGDQKNVAYPWSDSAGSTSSALVWKGSRWASGFYNVYPSAYNTISSYTVADQMITYFANKTLYPNLNQIVVAGHSLGAQYVNRYAAIGKSLGVSTPVRFWMGNPNDFLWYNTSRPVYRDPATACAEFDDWRQGLATDTTPNYNTGLLAKGRAAVLANFRSKSKIYAKGLQDSGDDSSSCAPYTVGANRDERFYEQLAQFPPTSSDNVDYVNIGHDAGGMFTSNAGLTRLFYDNFSGDSSRHADFGDRQQKGDSPNPDSANAAAPAIKGTGASGMTYQGCWTDNTDDTTGHALPKSVSPSVMSVEGCSAACATAGYSIAGMWNGNSCLCGNALSYQSLQVVDKGCFTPCAGDSTQMCGAGARLSVWSASAPTQRNATVTAASAGNFNYLGCYTDNQANRTLATGMPGGSSMTVETCAAACANYRYMGVEYSSECYCSNTLGGSVANATDCSYVCAGNSTERCGGASRLSVYNNTLTTLPTTTDNPGSAASPTASTSLATQTGYKGCVVDNGSSGRVLSTQTYTSSNNTIDLCRSACTAQGLPIAGLQYSTECWCGSKLAYAPTNVTDSDCNMACSGNSTLACGAGNRLSLYSDLSVLPVAVSPVYANGTADGAWKLDACYTDSVSARSLSVGATGGSVEKCAASCKDYPMFGVEYGGECYCGSSLASTAASTATTECNMVCSGDETSYCGAGNRLLVYKAVAAAANSTTTTSTSTTATATATATDAGTTTSTSTMTSSTSTSDSSTTTSSSTISSTTTSSTTTSTSSTSTSTTTAAPTSTSTTSTTTSSTSTSTTSTTASNALPTSYTALGCYLDGGARTLSSASYSNSSNTPAQCAAFCRGKGYRYSGTEYASECYCGNTLSNSGASGSGQTGCTYSCSGDSTQKCGGPNRLNIVRDETWKQNFFTVQQYNQWNFTDCVVDTTSARVLNVTLNAGSKMTVQTCLNSCASANLTYCGMEYSGECYGATALPAKVTSAPASSGSSDPISRGCSMACAGDSTLACGGSNRLNLYTLTTSLSPDAGTVLQYSN